MFHAYIVEIGPQAVGVVTPENGAYRFTSIKSAFDALDDQLFETADCARSAALRLGEDADPSRSALTPFGAAI